MAKNPRLIDLSGRTIGLWEVRAQAGNDKRGGSLWSCTCSCGTDKIVRGGDLRSGKSVSCGCQSSRATIGQRSATHRQSNSRLYYCWQNMLARCKNKLNKNYGGKGIKVCDEWLSFEPFAEWANASGYAETLTIERIDNAYGYSPSNCTWADAKQQARHRSIVKMKTDQTSWAEIAEIHGVPPRVMNTRVNSGAWPIEKAATAPIGSVRAFGKRDASGRFVIGGPWSRKKSA